MRSRDLTQVQPRKHHVSELDQAVPEPVAARLLHVLHEAARDERREEARDAARIEAGATRDLVRAERAVRVREHIDKGKGALYRADESDGWLSGPRHGS